MKNNRIKTIVSTLILLIVISSICSCGKSNMRGIESIDFENKYASKDKDSLLTDAQKFLSDLYNLKVTTGEKAEREISLWDGDYGKTKKVTLFGYNSTLYMFHNEKENAYTIDNVLIDLADVSESEYKAIAKAFADALVEISNGDITVYPYVASENGYKYDHMSARELKILLSDGWESWKNNWEDVYNIDIRWFDTDNKTGIFLNICYKYDNSDGSVSNDKFIKVTNGDSGDAKHKYIYQY